MIVITTTAGQVTAHARSTLFVSGQFGGFGVPLSVETDGVAPNSGDVVKTYVGRDPSLLGAVVDTTAATIARTTKPDDAVYGLDQAVPVEHSCVDERGGSGATCSGVLPSAGRGGVVVASARLGFVSRCL